MSCQQKPTEKITIATAANMQFAMKALTEAFKEYHQIDCELIISSSGKLTAQIKEGAPYDVFVGANMKYPEAIFQSGLAAHSPRIYAKGKLVLWTMDEEIEVSLDILSFPEIDHIALANPKTAPYGIAAMDVLNHYQLIDQVKEKLVYGESIAQTNQFITSKAAKIGFTAMSVVLSPEMKGKGKWLEIDPSTYRSIDQGVVLLKKEGKDIKDAQLFYDFLFSSEAHKILNDYGYLVE
ncbi:molybdate ABC transporter substrate-binding protein [Echinicola jeungdonensis]|uniref:molybdate ABC transporter substrate-binding protein n=1 Tax=Echinicola jeungdonensis TaxID=709343 RepID=UPI0025B57EE0|nr:molybdate ABC transporter substrate-binding protein [Echinicola jeungdonensis]MDN3669813.1 molybdate ABC transporter substrate-binding protein [Echinicola jeungdonensis]